MYPQIVISDSIVIPVYALSYVVCILLALIISYRELQRHGIPKGEFPAFAFWTILGGMIGNKIFFIIFFDWQQFLQAPWETLTSGGGGMHYGSEIGGLIGLLLYAWKSKLNAWKLLDAAGIVYMLTHGLGRVGCYMAGCCYGTETNSILGVTFPHMSHPVHPTQLYETVPLLITFMVFWVIRKKITIPGLIYLSYVILYSVLRFTIEFYRDDAYKFGILKISPSQHIALIMGITAFVFFIIKIKERQNTAAADQMKNAD